MILNAINTNTTKWTNTLKKLAGNSRQIVWVCLTVLWGWRVQGLMWNTSGNVFLGHLGEQVFHQWGSPLIPRYPLNFRGSCYNIQSSPMQHLRWSSLRQKIGNCCKLLLQRAPSKYGRAPRCDSERQINLDFFKAIIKYSIWHLHVQTLASSNYGK